MTGGTEAVVRLSVPGKVILMGEHAAVYGRPAVVAALGLRLRVEAGLASTAGAGGHGVRVDLSDIAVEERHSWPALADFAGQARRRWLAFRAGEASFRVDRDRGALVRVAVGEALASLGASASARLREHSLDLRVQSAIPVGAGLGSSAAAAVGVVAAVRALAGGLGRVAPKAGRGGGKSRAAAGGALPAGPETRHAVARAGVEGAEVAAGGALPAGPGNRRAGARAGVEGAELRAIEAAALEVERRQHGLPSGIDSGTVLRGGVLFVRPAGKALRFEDLPRREWLRSGLLVADSGTPGQTTGAVVTTVRRRYEQDPEGLAEILDRLGGAAAAFREALVEDREPRAAAAVAAGHRGLVELGVVPPAIAARISRVESAGGAAKISGAGALEGESAGALICMPGGRGAGAVEGLSDLAPVDAPIGADGLRFED